MLKHDSISVRIRAWDKIALQWLADQEGMSLVDYISRATLFYIRNLRKEKQKGLIEYLRRRGIVRAEKGSYRAADFCEGRPCDISGTGDSGDQEGEASSYSGPSDFHITFDEIRQFQRELKVRMRKAELKEYVIADILGIHPNTVNVYTSCKKVMSATQYLAYKQILEYYEQKGRRAST